MPCNSPLLTCNHLIPDMNEPICQTLLILIKDCFLHVTRLPIIRCRNFTLSLLCIVHALSLSPKLFLWHPYVMVDAPSVRLSRWGVKMEFRNTWNRFRTVVPMTHRHPVQLLIEKMVQCGFLLFVQLRIYFHASYKETTHLVKAMVDASKVIRTRDPFRAVTRKNYILYRRLFLKHEKLVCNGNCQTSVD